MTAAADKPKKQGQPTPAPASPATAKVLELPPRKVGMIVPNRVQLAEQGRNIHLVTVPSGQTPQDFLEPSYWGMVAKSFQPYDHVEVRCDDRTFWGLYIVLACDRTWAKLEPMIEKSLPSADDGVVHPEFTIEWKGPHLKYSVIRLSDMSVVHEGEQERRGAVAWLEGYARTIGSTAA